MMKKPLDGEAGSKNGRVLPQQNNGEPVCARCERPLSKPERSSSMSGGKSTPKNQDHLDVSSAKNNRSNSIGQKNEGAASYSINDDGKLKTP